jgi:hypothetical protein
LINLCVMRKIELNNYKIVRWNELLEQLEPSALRSRANLVYEAAHEHGLILPYIDNIEVNYIVIRFYGNKDRVCTLYLTGGSTLQYTLRDKHINTLDRTDVQIPEFIRVCAHYLLIGDGNDEGSSEHRAGHGPTQPGSDFLWSNTD